MPVTKQPYDLHSTGSSLKNNVALSSSGMPVRASPAGGDAFFQKKPESPLRLTSKALPATPPQHEAASSSDPGGGDALHTQQPNMALANQHSAAGTPVFDRTLLPSIKEARTKAEAQAAVSLKSNEKFTDVDEDRYVPVVFENLS